MIVGDSFEKEHWASLLYNLLKLDRKITPETLKFNDLMMSVDILLEKKNEIGELCRRAQGEVTIREAITELRVWCETCAFELVDHECAGDNIKLIKDWKELMTQISDNLAQLSALKESKYIGPFIEHIMQ